MIKIREFKKKDALEVSKLVEKTVLALPKETYGPYLAEYFSNNSSKVLKDFLQKGVILVAVEGERIVGTVRLDFKKQKIFGMFVDPSFQGKGVGRKLLVAIEKLAKQNGFKQVGLSSTIPAVRFYEKNGFKRICENQVSGSITVSGPVVDMKKTLFSTKN